ncbi:MAG: hypothetical protein UW16_C0002G0028 [Microgenomates group bacterium GW2011_GWC1_44_10]|nr:MAG: hypothetical protein UW16_C0002G0028 [Microgenomates group bacterium GW2011_GWC1_44_10]
MAGGVHGVVGVREVFAQQGKVFVELFVVFLDGAEQSEHFGGFAGDLLAFQRKKNGLEMGVESSGRDGIDTGLTGQIEKLLFANYFVINTFGGNVHEGEVQSAFFRENIFTGDILDVFFDVADEGGTGGGFVGRRGGGVDLLKIFHGELAVDRENTGLGFDGGVNYLARLEVILKMEAVLGEHLSDEVFEDLFADVAPELGGLEIVLEIFHGATDLAEGAGFFLQVGDDRGRLIQTGK